MNTNFKRFGPNKDGGYILCDTILKNHTDIIYSYGINSNDPTSCEISNKYNSQMESYECYEFNYWRN